MSLEWVSGKLLIIDYSSKRSQFAAQHGEKSPVKNKKKENETTWVSYSESVIIVKLL